MPTTRKQSVPSGVGSAKVREFELVQGPFRGYRAREDITMLPLGILVKGSKNVLTNTAQRISKRKGYKVDGQTNTTITQITSAFDWTKLLNNDTHMRSYSDTLEWRYENSSGTVLWKTLKSSFPSTNFNYTTMFDTAELFNVALFVNGTSNIYEWSGAYTTYASSTTNTITKQGTDTWTQAGFYSQGNMTATTISFTNASPATLSDSAGGFTAAGFRAGQTITISGSTSNNVTRVIAKVTDTTITVTGSLVTEAAGDTVTIVSQRQIILNGTTYTYTGGENTTTLTGVTPNVVAGTAGDVIYQAIRTVQNSQMLGLPSAFKNDGISNLAEQIFIGCKTSSDIYISQLSNFCDYQYSSPRQPGEGAKKTMTGYWRAFIVQDTDMYVSAGTDIWYKTEYDQTTTTTTVSDTAVSVTYEQINLLQLKTTAQQAALSQAVVTKIKNNIAYLSAAPIINTLGPVSDVFQTPQVTDISYPIINDMNKYDFTDAAAIYFKQYLYVSVPREELILVYNMTDGVSNKDGGYNHYWECPQTIPVGRFSIINDQLYGHGYLVPETYELFVGYRDRAYGDTGATGHPIPAEARFSYQNNGVRSYKKSMNAFYTEGYISPNTELTIGILYDIDGCAIDTNYTQYGNDLRTVCIPTNDNSLGKFSLGKQPLGLDLEQDDPDALPPKFRVIKTFPRVPYYEEQTYFSSEGMDEQWEIVAFGGNATPTTEGPVGITE